MHRGATRVRRACEHDGGSSALDARPAAACRPFLPATSDALSPITVRSDSSSSSSSSSSAHCSALSPTTAQAARFDAPGACNAAIANRVGAHQPTTIVSDSGDDVDESGAPSCAANECEPGTVARCCTRCSHLAPALTRGGNSLVKRKLTPLALWPGYGYVLRGCNELQNTEPWHSFVEIARCVHCRLVLKESFVVVHVAIHPELLPTYPVKHSNLVDLGIYYEVSTGSVCGKRHFYAIVWDATQTCSSHRAHRDELQLAYIVASIDMLAFRSSRPAFLRSNHPTMRRLLGLGANIAMPQPRLDLSSCQSKRCAV